MFKHHGRETCARTCVCVCVWSFSPSCVGNEFSTCDILQRRRRTPSFFLIHTRCDVTVKSVKPERVQILAVLMVCISGELTLCVNTNSYLFVHLVGRILSNWTCYFLHSWVSLTSWRALIQLTNVSCKGCLINVHFSFQAVLKHCLHLTFKKAWKLEKTWHSKIKLNI